MNEGQNYWNSLTTTLLVVFVVLKLTNNITWSWWWVMSPLWIPAVLAVLLGILVVVIKEQNK